LKEKRMIVRSLVGKVRSKFTISISEVEALDMHQTVILGLSIVTNETQIADTLLNQVISYIQENTEAELLDIDREIITDF
ncbi:MAG: DUF503 domain-containing protein, partial [Zhenhengia sp.]